MDKTRQKLCRHSRQILVYQTWHRTESNPERYILQAKMDEQINYLLHEGINTLSKDIGSTESKDESN